MGNQVDADLATVRQVPDLVDGQADAIDRDRALESHEAAQRRRRQHLQFPAFADLGKSLHGADTVDMAGHDMAAEPIMGTQRFLEIDRSALGQTGGLVQRLGRHVDLETVRCQVDTGGGHACAVDGDAVADTDVVEISVRANDGQALAMG